MNPVSMFANDKLERCLLIPAGTRLAAIKRMAPHGFKLRENAPCAWEDLEFYDTFDWSVWFAGLTLYRRGDELRLVERSDGSEVATVSTMDLADAAPPRFWWECPESEMRECLKPLVKLRALTPVATFSRRTRSLEMLNDDGKIVARSMLERYSLIDRPKSVFLRLCRSLPMRGYDAEMEMLENAFEKAGFAATTIGPLEAFFDRIGEAPEKRVIKPTFAIDPSQPARETVRGLITAMSRVARSNESGLSDDVDTEFLHHYRVSMRKIRSLLSLLKGVFPRDVTVRLKREFSRIVKRTNRLRDLDVYLLNRCEYENMLPGFMRAGLNDMFDDYATERKAEQKRVKRYLRSRAYEAKITELEDFFHGPDVLPASPNSGVAIKKLAAGRIGKAYKRIRHFADSFDERTPNKNIHRLRIQCKKMRYLLEFFACLFDRDGVVELTNRLKKLQDKLGLFNDLSVQQSSLREYAETKMADGKTHSRLLLALGGLIASLNNRHQAQRCLIMEDLRDFTNADARSLCERVLKTS